MKKSRFFLYFHTLLTRFYFQYWSWSVSRTCSLGFPAFSSLIFTKRKNKLSDRSLMVGFPGLSSRQKPFTCCCRSPASLAVSSPRPTAPAAVPSPAAVRNSGTPEKPAEPWWHAFPLSQSAPSLPRQRAGPEPQLLQPEKINKNKKTGGTRELLFSMRYIQYVHVWAWNWIHQISKERVSALKISRK